MTLSKRKPVPIPEPSLTAYAAVAPGAPPLLVRYQRQEQGNWCWAACGSMLVDYYKHQLVQQCDFASAMFGLVCCQTPLAQGCDQGAWPEDIYGHFGVGVTKIGRSASDSEVSAQLGAGNPLEVYFAWTGGGAHVALIAGRLPNGDYLVLDPWYGQGTRSADAVRTGYGGGLWDATYWTQGT